MTITADEDSREREWWEKLVWVFGKSFGKEFAVTLRIKMGWQKVKQGA